MRMSSFEAWKGPGSYLAEASHRENDLPDVGALLHVAMRVAGLVERKGFRHHWRESSGAHFVEHEVHRGGEMSTLVPEMREVQTKDAAIVVDERQRLETRHLHHGLR